MPCTPSLSAERDLQTGILKLGTMLGWDAPTVARFTEAVTGRPWHRCDQADLQQVLEAYESLGRRMRAVQARRPQAAESDRRTP